MPKRTEEEVRQLCERELRLREQKQGPLSEDYKEGFRRSFCESYHDAYDEAVRKQTRHGQHRSKPIRRG
jgi:hypothetical protein